MTSMTRSSQLPESSAGTPPPCSAEPDRWFDRAHRTSALATCLQCPERRWCARQALDTRARFGMWAGIWIDGCPEDVADLLRDIATTGASASTKGVVERSPVSRTDSDRAPLPRRPVVPPGSVASAVLARSSGHCEVFADGCRVNAAARVSRLASSSVDEATSAASVFAACAPCAQRLNQPEGRPDARRLGHLVDSVNQLPSVPFCWRGTRWVYLGPHGELHEVDSGAESAHAC